MQRQLRGVLLIALQSGVVIRQVGQAGDWPRHRQVISAGTAHADPGLIATHIHLGGPALLRQAGLQPRLVLGLLVGAKLEVGLVAAIAGTDAVVIVVGRGEVAIVAEHGVELAQVHRGRHMAHLATHRVEWQLGKGDERRQLMAGGHHQIGTCQRRPSRLSTCQPSACSAMATTSVLNATSSSPLACASLMAARVRSAGQSQPPCG